MAIPLPNLDDRRWSELVAESVAQLPVVAPLWTDHNIHDPGRMLIELLAAESEQNQYWLNRVPSTQQRAYLAIAGVDLNPPQAAQTVVQFLLKENEAPRVLPANTKVGRPIQFQTNAPLFLAGGTIETVTSNDLKEVVDLTAQWQNGRLLLPFGADPQVGATFTIGLSQPLPQNETPQLYMLLHGDQATATERARLVSERAWRASCQPAHARILCDDTEQATATIDDILTHYEVMLVWEVWTSQGWQETAVTDHTRSLSLSGAVQFKNVPEMVEQKGVDGTPRYHLRCRIVGGQYGCAPKLVTVVLNGTLAQQRVTVESERVGEGNGRPNQSFTLTHAPLLAQHCRIVTEAKVNGTMQESEWQIVPSLTASTPADKHVVVDFNNGNLQFGDGQRGHVAPNGEHIVAKYEATSTTLGNVPAGYIKAFSASDQQNGLHQAIDVISNPIAGHGGADAETIGEAMVRYQMTPSPRAVTLADYVRLAKDTPGVCVARAEALANVHPAMPTAKAKGVVTVMVLPQLPQKRAFPTLAMRREVQHWLEHHRIVGTKVVVAGPTWQTVRVRARVTPIDGIDQTALPGKVSAAIDAYFDPLTGGKSGTGWPLGRDVYLTELYQVIDLVDGVDHVTSLALLDEAGNESCSNVCIGLLGLVLAGRHDILVQGDASTELKKLC